MKSTTRQEAPGVTPPAEQDSRCRGVSLRRRRSQRGAELLEASLTFLLFYAFLFLIIDLSMAVHAAGTLQQAVQLAARDASVGELTSVDSSGNPVTYTSLAARIASKAAANSFGLLTPATAPCKLTIQFWDQDAATPGNVTSLTLGHKIILTVQMSNYAYSPMGPIGHSPSPLHINAMAASVMECPFTGCPTAFDTVWPPASCH